MNYAFAMKRQTVVGLLGAALVAVGGGTLAAAPTASAGTELGFLIGVTGRPFYNFANAQQALAYGYGICDKIALGRPYAALVEDIKTDFNTRDEYSASYLISNAATELCPQLIFQLRNSAAGYVPTN